MAGGGVGMMSAVVEIGAADVGVVAGTTTPSMSTAVSATGVAMDGVGAFFEYFFSFLAFPFMLGPAVRVKWLTAAMPTGEENATLPAPKRARAMMQKGSELLTPFSEVARNPSVNIWWTGAVQKRGFRRAAAQDCAR